MKKTNLIVIAVVVILLILGAWFFIFNKKNPGVGQPAANSIESQGQAEQAKPGIKESLLGLVEGAAGVKCSVEDTNGKYTVVAKGSKVRIEGMNFFNAKPENSNPQNGAMISDGEWTYVWNGKEGMKFNIKETSADNSAPDPNAQAEASDWKSWAKSMEASGAQYDCNPTVATDADFTPPSDVKFQDFNELMKGFQQTPSASGIPANLDQFKVPGN